MDNYVGLPYDHLEFNCWTFVTKVYKEQLGINIQDFTPTKGKRDFTKTVEENFSTETSETWQEVNMPFNYCLVMMKSLKGFHGCHFGVWYNNHLYHCHGERYVGQVWKWEPSLVMSEYKYVSFYKHAEHKILLESDC